jgi:hypothetical protein
MRVFLDHCRKDAQSLLNWFLTRWLGVRQSFLRFPIEIAAPVYEKSNRPNATIGVMGAEDETSCVTAATGDLHRRLNYGSHC